MAIAEAGVLRRRTSDSAMLSSTSEGTPLLESRGPAAVFSGALLKVASRCNLNCDYCYVYQHADQGWREQPRFMAEKTLRAFAERLREYASTQELREFSITFHGGEPLLFGASRLMQAVEMIRARVGEECALDFSLQSNGTLLTEEAIVQLESANIGVSLSLDGPQEVNDRHRLDHSGGSSFAEVADTIKRLQARNSPIFRGVLAVIDPEVPPRTLLEFFTRLGVPRLDLLLPDATYERLPPGRSKDPTLYSAWLREALTLWVAEFSELPVRWFDALLASRLGVPSPTDAMGLGAVSLLVVDTDGSYTDHDVFKITGPGQGHLRRGVADTALEEISGHPTLREHGFRLTFEGLAPECRTCPAVEACGGGSVMHRWHPLRKLDAPSVYCPELFAGLEAATHIVGDGLRDQAVAASSQKLVSWLAGDLFTHECRRWRAETDTRATAAAERLGVRFEDGSAAALLLCERHEASWDLLHVRHGAPLHQWLGKVAVQSDDLRLVAPFKESIRVLPRDSAAVGEGIIALEKLPELFSALHPELPLAISALISDVIFVETTDGNSDRIFSFSDDTAPNVLYIAPTAGGVPLDLDDLGDSLLHEFLHQVLYQTERDGPMLLDHVHPRFPAPWRPGLRPAGGFFHGTFVFAGLSQYWAALARVQPSGNQQTKAAENAARFADQAIYGIESLRQFALLTERGKALLDQLASALGPNATMRMAAPGLSLLN